MSETTATKALRTLFEGIRDERRMYSNTATRIGNAFLALLSYLIDDTPYLRKDQEDSTQYLLRLLAGAIIGENAITLNPDGSITAKSVEMTDGVESSDFKAGETAGSGVGLYKDGSDWVLELDRLLVRKVATFLELEIRKLSYTAGNVVIGAAGSKISSVEEVYDADGNLIGWKCYYVSDDGTTATTNSWKVNDQARCEDFNIKEGVYQNVSNKYYWRLVTEVGDDYVTLSAGIHDDSTNNTDNAHIPSAGDTLTLMGHQVLRDVSDTDPEGTANKDRTNLILLSTTATDKSTVPSIVGYTAITDFDLSKAHKVFTLSPQEVTFHSSTFKWDNKDAEWPQPTFCGTWDSASAYDYGDEVTYDDCTWICVNSDGAEAGEEPTESSTTWHLVAGTPTRGRTMTIYMVYAGGLVKVDDGTLAYGETGKFVCYITDNKGGDHTSDYNVWTIERVTSDTASDAVWNAQAEISEAGEFELTWSDEKDDIGKDNSYATFIIKAYPDGDASQAVAASITI